MSWILGKKLVKRCLKKRLLQFKEKLDHHQDDLIYYLLFLRITPILPNWFINISCPILDVPISKFFIATFVGLMPGNFLHLRTGLMLNEIQTVGGIDLKNIAILFGIGFLSLLPTLCKKKLQERFD
eukprot:CAMPEP_0170541588 /NCGR_PEP_ID=MMETSP0211-20121228/1283_1 /TAXON_ID=311385 /ORGANISM="Pseudokeronopsis sp., Strain OXSARD2" /LENGTH=125 /DNA_ID=CAMNT_0010844373 /DNA_START=450 /DNA_END=827 /DNA_ORIENTATION=-